MFAGALYFSVGARTLHYVPALLRRGSTLRSLSPPPAVFLPDVRLVYSSPIPPSAAFDIASRAALRFVVRGILPRRYPVASARASITPTQVMRVHDPAALRLLAQLSASILGREEPVHIRVDWLLVTI